MFTITAKTQYTISMSECWSKIINDLSTSESEIKFYNEISLDKFVRARIASIIIFLFWLVMYILSVSTISSIIWVFSLCYLS